MTFWIMIITSQLQLHRNFLNIFKIVIGKKEVRFQQKSSICQYIVANIIYFIREFIEINIIIYLYF